MILAAAVLPGVATGAIVGGVGWRLIGSGRWWLGAVFGAIAGAATWFAVLRYW